MSNRTILAACALTLVAAISGCDRGTADNGTLIDGATDAPVEPAPADTAGPSSPPVNSAPPAAGDMPGVAGSIVGNNGPTIAIANQQAPGGGAYLVDSARQAVYMLEGDRDGSKCVGDCIRAWPPVLAANVQPTGAPGVQGGMIATITRPDGSTQVTYNGHPLYRYAADGGTESTNGHGVQDKFGHWYLISPQGEQLQPTKR